MAEKFVAARSLITSQPQQALAVCNELLMTLPHDTSHDMDGGIRVGDVYALMVSQ
jgi:intraflagellar transport protein 140